MFVHVYDVAEHLLYKPQGLYIYRLEPYLHTLYTEQP